MTEISNFNDASKGKEENFLCWLRENGAVLGKCSWPTTNVENIRSVVATNEIKPEEYILQIPSSCILSVNQAIKLKDLGSIFEVEKHNLLRGDCGLVLFIMHELRKGKDSFYAPYLSILPEPYILEQWESKYLLEIQDKKLVDFVLQNSKKQKEFFEAMIGQLCTKYPMHFNREAYNFDLYLKAWRLVRTRAFGKRLPFSALVPYADMFNHGNVATKYDYNVDGNETFRLWSTSSNSIKPNAEILNSYGRHPNFILLLEYGFALENNEWDSVVLELGSSVQIRLRRNQWSNCLMDFFRKAVTIHDSNMNYSSSEFRLKREILALRAAREEININLETFETTLAYDEDQLEWSRYASFRNCENDETSYIGSSGMNSEMSMHNADEQSRTSSIPHMKMVKQNNLNHFQSGQGLISEESGSISIGYSEKFLEHSSDSNQLFRDILPCTNLYKSNRSFEMVQALKYRVTRKRIYTSHMEMLDHTIDYVEKLRVGKGQYVEIKFDSTVCNDYLVSLNAAVN